MENMTPEKIAEVTGGRYIGRAEERKKRVQGAVRDNREVKPGNMFICISGKRADGHNYTDSAYGAGAACCIAEREIPDAKGPYVLVSSTQTALGKLGGYYRRQFNIPVIGITGSVGKTTVKEMTSAVLSEKLRVHKTQENMNNELGVPLTLLSMDSGIEAAVIEMGISEFGEMSRLSEMVRPDISIMTKIGYSHLETLGSREGVLRAKSEIYRYMKPTATAIINGDDDLLRGYETGLRTLTYGLKRNNDIYAERIETEETEAVLCDIIGGGVRLPVRIPTYGRHHIQAALAAVQTGRLLGLTDDEIVKGLMRYKPISGRANVQKTDWLTLIDDCYNANPNSVSASLQSLASLRRSGSPGMGLGRRVAILGDMKDLGTQSAQLHYNIGKLAGELGIELLICCGIESKQIYDGAISERGSITVEYYPEKTELLRAIPSLIKRGDKVLVKASHSMGFDSVCAILLEL